MSGRARDVLTRPGVTPTHFTFAKDSDLWSCDRGSENVSGRARDVLREGVVFPSGVRGAGTVSDGHPSAPLHRRKTEFRLTGDSVICIIYAKLNRER